MTTTKKPTKKRTCRSTTPHGVAPSLNWECSLPQGHAGYHASKVDGFTVKRWKRKR